MNPLVFKGEEFLNSLEKIEKESQEVKDSGKS